MIPDHVPELDLIVFVKQNVEKQPQFHEKSLNKLDVSRYTQSIKETHYRD